MSALPLPDPPLSNGEIALRPWRKRDASALTALCQDEVIVRWTNVPAGYTEDMARARIAEAEAERQAGRALVLAVVDADTDELIGACDLRLAASDPHHAEIAYMLDAQVRGRGVNDTGRQADLAVGDPRARRGAHRDIRPPREPTVHRGCRTSRVHQGKPAARLPRQEGSSRGPGGSIADCKRIVVLGTSR